MQAEESISWLAISQNRGGERVCVSIGKTAYCGMKFYFTCLCFSCHYSLGAFQYYIKQCD